MQRNNNIPLAGCRGTITQCIIFLEFYVIAINFNVRVTETYEHFIMRVSSISAMVWHNIRTMSKQLLHPSMLYIRPGGPDIEATK
jgi:hypothetical protein